MKRRWNVPSDSIPTDHCSTCRTPLAINSIRPGAPFFDVLMTCDTCGFRSTVSVPIYSPNACDYLARAARPKWNRLRIELLWLRFCATIAASYITDIWRKRNPFDWHGRW